MTPTPELEAPYAVEASDLGDAIRRKPVAVGLSAVISGVIAWFTHVWIVARRYDGLSGPVRGFEVVPVTGNRIWGYVIVVLWSVPIGFGIGLVLTGGFRKSGRLIADRSRFIRTAARAVDAKGHALGLILAASGGVTWVLLQIAFRLIASQDPITGHAQRLSRMYAALLAIYTLLAATAVLGGRLATRVGRSLQSAGLRPGGPPLAVGSVALAGLAAGFALPFLLDYDAAVLLVCIGFVAGAMVKAKGPGAQLTLMFFVAAASVLIGGAASADDGGWAECGASLRGYTECPGTDLVLRDAGHAVPSGLTGGALGGLIAVAVLTRRARPRRSGSPTDIRAVPRAAPPVEPVTEDLGDMPTHTVRLESARDVQADIRIEEMIE
ncbi:MAG: hypothetical protein ACRD0K_03500 [Egibacteraceae bacterium]